MQEAQMVLPEGASHLKSRKKKPLNQVVSAIQKKGETNRSRDSIHPSTKPKKVLKKNLTPDGAHFFQQRDAPTPDSTQDPSISSDDYRALRHEYLLLEEESFSLDKELSEVVGEVRTLEDDKSLLLDQLVVLEGLVDP